MPAAVGVLLARTTVVVLGATLLVLTVALVALHTASSRLAQGRTGASG